MHMDMYVSLLIREQYGYMFLFQRKIKTVIQNPLFIFTYQIENISKILWIYIYIYICILLFKYFIYVYEEYKQPINEKILGI